MRDFEQTLLELAPSALHWIAVVGFATAGGAFGFGIFVWIVARAGGDKSAKFIHWLGVGAFLAVIPGGIALAAVIRVIGWVVAGFFPSRKTEGD